VSGLDAWRLARDLRALGLGPGDVVMVHTSLSALGRVEGGAETVVAALLEATAPGGTLLAYTSWRDAPPYDLAGPDGSPPFDPATAPAALEVGRVPEALRRHPEALRSRHPDVSFAAVGPLAGRLTAEHPWDNPHGPGSPLARLVEADGLVLLLGAPLGTMTLLHHAEAIAPLPGKRRVRYRMPVRGEDGRTVWREFCDIDTDRGAFDYERVLGPGVDEFEVIVAAMLAAGIGTTGRVGEAAAHLVPARIAVDFAVGWLVRTFSRR
jgi:aminoglycoside 3-N-acetyltransferase